MSIDRKFLGLDRAGLAAVVDYLYSQYADSSAVDLSGVLAVVPGRRVGRRLLELLAIGAQERGRMLTPPVIETVGRVAEHLYRPRRPFASEMTQHLVWANVVRSAGELLNSLRPPREGGEPERWSEELGALLRRQHIELAADGLDFRNVADHVESIGGRQELQRWDALAQLQESYHRRLDELGLWDRQTARLKAIEFGECRTESAIVLVGTVDINVALRKMLDAVAHKTTALIVALPEWEDRFDAHGCLIPARWQDVQLPLEDDQIHVADGPRDQALEVVQCVAGYEGRYEASEIVIGVPDAGLVSEIERQMERAGVRTRWGLGEPLSQSHPFRLLQTIGEVVSRSRFEDFARLVRHPDIDNWLHHLGFGGDWLTELDRYQSDCLPYRIPDRWLGAPSKTKNIRTVARRLLQLLQPLMEGDRTLVEWREILTELLQQVYQHRRLDRAVAAQRMTIHSCRRVMDTLADHATIPAALAPSVSATEAIRLTLDVVRKDWMASESGEAVELLGWLELPLDDAPALVLASLNEGFIPESVNSDLFLPNTLRSKLGLLDNARRYARDAYALHVLLATRGSFHAVVGRRTAAGDPLTPSRLLFATHPSRAARRAQRLFGRMTPAGESRAAAVIGDRDGPRLAVPPPRRVDQPLEEFRVTSLRDYLACPYRFYLKHVLKLRAVDDHADELDGAAFGTLAHEVLRRFGESSSRDSVDPDEIQRVLSRELDRCVTAQHAGNVMPAVRVQVEQLRLRLAAFAGRQAAWAQEGWRFAHVESRNDQLTRFQTESGEVYLCGRIDRVDVHPETGGVAILDYKTSDTAKSPDQTHRTRGRWVDLQLPLYRHLADSLDLSGAIELGFVLIPRDTNRVAFEIASWSDAELEQADQVAREVICAIREQRFWPPADPAPDFSEVFAGICQDRVLERPESLHSGLDAS